MQKLMIKAQDKAKSGICRILLGPKLKQQLADTKGFSRVRAQRRSQSRYSGQKEIAENLDKLPDVLKRGRLSRCAGRSAAAYRKAEAVVEQYSVTLPHGSGGVREERKPAQKVEQKPPERRRIETPAPASGGEAS